MVSETGCIAGKTHRFAPTVPGAPDRCRRCDKPDLPVTIALTREQVRALRTAALLPFVGSETADHDDPLWEAAVLLTEALLR